MREACEMQNAVFNIALLSAPLLLASFGALTSEYSGRMAVFLDGIINLSAFFCYAFSVLTGSFIAGVFLSVFCCMLIIFVSIRAVESLHANPFLASLGLNLFTGALASVISVALFGTRGVLTSPLFSFPAASARLWTGVVALVFTAAGFAFLYGTKYGLYIRITGKDADVLVSRGIDVSACRTAAWCIAAFYGSLAGCILSFRLSSFVPNISSGRGWLALAAVFLGRRTGWGMTAAVIVLCAAEYVAANLQNVFQNIASPLLIALPYIASLALIVLVPDTKRGE